MAMLGRKKKLGNDFVWLGQRALDCIGLHELIDFKLILSCDYGLETEQVSSRSGARVISVEKNTFMRENWSNHDINRLFSKEMMPDVSHALSIISRPSVIAYCLVPSLEEIAQRNDKIKLLAASSQLKYSLDNKIHFRKILPTLGIEPLPVQIVYLSSVTYEDLLAKYKTPFIVQLPYGASGSSSFLIHHIEEFQSLKLRYPLSQVVISKFIDGISPNVNAVVLENDVLVSYPSIQLIGISECSRRPLTYCGNDFFATKHLSQSMLKDLYSQTKIIGSWLRSLGFRGLFGLDFIVGSGKVYPVEINPRFQGSTQLLTEAQLKKKYLPLAYYHVLNFLGETDKTLATDQMFFDPINASQVVIHNTNDYPCIVHGYLAPGIYQLENNQPVYKRSGISFSDCVSENEFAVTCAVPREDTIVQPDAPLLKLHLPFPALDTNSNKLDKSVSTIVAWINARLNLVAL